MAKRERHATKSKIQSGGRVFLQTKKSTQWLKKLKMDKNGGANNGKGQNIKNPRGGTSSSVINGPTIQALVAFSLT